MQGRLVDPAGLPVPGAEVDVEAVGDTLRERCAGVAASNVTDERGDFFVCFHKHAFRPSLLVRLRSGEAVVERPVDVDLRKVDAILVDPAANGTAPEGWTATHLVGGRVWTRGLAELDGVPVTGIAIPRAHVDVRVVDAEGGERWRGDAFTDAFGDYAAVVELDASAGEELAVRIEAQGGSAETPLDTHAHRTFLDLRLSDEDVATPLPPAPGERAGPVPMWLIVGVVVAAAASTAIVLRKK